MCPNIQQWDATTLQQFCIPMLVSFSCAFSKNQLCFNRTMWGEQSCQCTTLWGNGLFACNPLWNKVLICGLFLCHHSYECFHLWVGTVCYRGKTTRWCRKSDPAWVYSLSRTVWMPPSPPPGYRFCEKPCSQPCLWASKQQSACKPTSC